MESKTPRVTLSENEQTNQSPKSSPSPSKTKALIQCTKSKSNFTESLLKARYRFLGRKPTTTFHLFPLLPQELQLHIIVAALRNGGEVIIAKPNTNGVPGWWSAPHSFLSVNQIFRQQTQVLRPKAFALIKRPLYTPAAATPSPEDLAHASSFLQGFLGTFDTPAHIDFDFRCDTLAISSRLLGSTLAEAEVPDLKRIDTIVISWVNFSGFPHLIDYLCRRYSNIRTIGLIHQALLDHGHSKTYKGERRHFTGSGPFLRSEIQMREWVEGAFTEQASHIPGVQVPRIVSLRVTQNSAKSWRRFPRAIDILGRWRDAWTIHSAKTEHDRVRRLL
jgi:hypothetical protein